MSDTPIVIDVVKEEEANHIVGWLILEAISEPEYFNSVFPNQMSPTVTVQLLVNNVSVPIIKVLNKVERQFDKLIEEKAKELIESRFLDVNCLLSELEEKVKNKIGKE